MIIEFNDNDNPAFPPRPAGRHVPSEPTSMDPESTHILYNDAPPATPPEPGAQVITLIIIGSFGWTNRGAVSDAINELWMLHDKTSFQIVTSGCPQGAEAIAREMAVGFGWPVVNIRDEELSALPSALVLGFIKDRSLGASELLKTVEEKFWTRIYAETTVRQVSGWVNR